MVDPEMIVLLAFLLPLPLLLLLLWAAGCV
jgi:hypothetical protein